MKKLVSFILIITSAFFILASCETASKRPEVPQGTVGSINFVKGKDNQFKIVVLNKKGKPFDVKTSLDKKAQHASGEKLLPGQQKNEVRLFFVDGSCIVKVCPPFVPCQPVLIEDDAKCAELGIAP